VPEDETKDEDAKENGTVVCINEASSPIQNILFYCINFVL